MASLAKHSFLCSLLIWGEAKIFLTIVWRTFTLIEVPLMGLLFFLVTSPLANHFMTVSCYTWFVEKPIALLNKVSIAAG